MDILQKSVQEVINASTWENMERVNNAFSQLRSERRPIWVEDAEFRPFWLLTSFDQVAYVDRNSDRFTALPRPSLQPKAMEEIGLGRTLSTLSHKDGRDHREHRSVTMDWFKSVSIGSLSAMIDRIAEEAVEELADMGGEADLAAEIAWRFPMRVILEVLDLPTTDVDYLVRITHQLFAYSDAELSRSRDPRASLKAVDEFMNYFGCLIRRKQQQPSDDLASLIANAVVAGGEVSNFSKVSYLVSIAAGGIYTVTLCIAGGLYEFLRKPDTLQAIGRSDIILAGAVEEMVRWTTPIRHMMRTAQEDSVIDGTEIKKGEACLISYVAANRDPEAFQNPDSFDPFRPQNRHLAFGVGPHYCLGAPLARLMLTSLFRVLSRRLELIALSGDVAWVESTLIGGIKHLPVQFSIRSQS